MRKLVEVRRIEHTFGSQRGAATVLAPGTCFGEIYDEQSVEIIALTQEAYDALAEPFSNPTGRYSIARKDWRKVDSDRAAQVRAIIALMDNPILPRPLLAGVNEDG